MIRRGASGLHTWSELVREGKNPFRGSTVAALLLLLFEPLFKRGYYHSSQAFPRDFSDF